MESHANIRAYDWLHRWQNSGEWLLGRIGEGETIRMGVESLPSFFRDVVHATGDPIDVRVKITNGMATICAGDKKS